MEANNSLLPTDSGKGVKGYATDNANGTGPFSRSRAAALIREDRLRPEHGVVGQAAAQY